jgi:hypothetical protein
MNEDKPILTILTEELEGLPDGKMQTLVEAIHKAGFRIKFIGHYEPKTT